MSAPAAFRLKLAKAEPLVHRVLLKGEFSAVRFTENHIDGMYRIGQAVLDQARVYEV